MKFKYGKLLILFLLTVIQDVSGKAYADRPLSIITATADCPEINDKNINIIPSTCNGSDGKILGITATGTGSLHFTWFDSENNIVGSAADLVNVPAGKYHFQLRDDSKCKTVVSINYFVGDKDPVIIDNTKTIVTNTSCNGADGSITNIAVTNATQYQWTDDQNKVLSTTPDLKNVALGTYILKASNSFGCMATSKYIINSNVAFPPLIQVDTTLAFCGGPGGLTLTFTVNQNDPTYTYAVIQEGGSDPVKNGTITYNVDNPGKAVIKLPELGPGVTYILYIIDANNCQMRIAFKLPEVVYKIDASKAVIHNDYCGQHIGTIVSLKVLGRHPGQPAPNEYLWRDESGKVVSGTIFLAGVAAGKYTFTATDPMGCTDSKEFTITDSTTISTPPILNDLKMCLPGVALITVIKPDTGGYNLYDSTETFVTANKFGTFPVNVKKTSFYYVTHTNGTCESSKIKVTVTVSLPGISIPNTFTPNSDGINDVWNITGIEQYPNTEVNIFDKTGQLIYHSLGYGRPFDGRYKGKVLPPDVYYYTLDTKKIECTGQISGSLTIIR